MKRSFHEKMEEINEDVLVMGSLVQDAVHNSIEALVNMDPRLAGKVIEGDEKVNEYDISIEEKCIVLQAEHQPVAIDLRFLHSVSILIKSIERIGDLAVNIAKVVIRLSKEKEKKNIDKDIIDLLVEMGNLVKPELGEEDIKFVTNIALASRYLERIGDQSVNIGDRVLYFLTGDYTVFHDDFTD